MVLPEQVNELTFGAGLAEQKDRWLQPDGFQRLENCLQEKTGALVKAPGFSSFADSFVNATGEHIEHTTVGENPKLIARGNQIGAVAGGYLYAKNEQWVLQGRVSPWVAEQRTVVDVAGRKGTSTLALWDTVRHDCCRSGDWAFTVFNYWGPDDLPANARLCVVCTYLPTGATTYQMITEAEAYGLSAPRIIPWSDNGEAILVYRREENPATDWGTVCYRKVTPGTLGPEIDTGRTCTVFDVDVDTTNPIAGVMWLVYHPGDAVSVTTQEVELIDFSIGSTALTQLSAVTHTTLGLPRSVTVAGDQNSNRVSVAYAQTTSDGGGSYVDEVQAFCRQAADLTLQVWPTLPLTTTIIGLSNSFPSDADSEQYRITQLAAIDLGGSLGSYFLWFDPNGTLATYGGEFTNPGPTTRGVKIDASGNVSPKQQAGRIRMRTRPFFDGIRICFLGEHSSAADAAANDRNSYYVLLGAEPFGAPPLLRFVPLGFFSQGNASSQAWSSGTGGPDLYWMQSTPYQDADGAWTVQAIERDPGTLRVRIRAYRLVSDDRVGVSFQLGEQTYVVGALLSAWDGLRALEAGWLADPVIDAITQVAGTLAAGTRHYVLTYARTNAAGELLRSHPSAVVTATNDASENNRLRIAPYCLSNVVASDHLDMVIEIWRTKDGQASPFYLLRREPLDVNNRDVLLIDDAVSDFNLTFARPVSLPFEESPGAELPNDAPISPVHGGVWKNRIWLTDGEQIAYSKEGLPNRVAEFSLSQTIPRATQKRLTAVGPLGDVLIAFTEDSTAYIYGDAPAANGQGSSLTGPVELQTEIGCTQPSGLCVLPTGLLVPTRKGLQALTLKREYADVGEAIEGTRAEFPRVRDVDWQKGTDRVWVALSNDAGTSGLFVVWDMQHNTWARVFQGFHPCSVVSVGDSQHWTNANGLTRDPAPGTWRIGTEEYRQVIETAWFKPGGALAEIRFRRAWLLAEPLAGSTSGLVISIAYDFDEDYQHAATFTNAELAALEGGTDGVLMLRIPASRQRCHAFRLKLEELLPVTDPLNQADSEGLRFVAMRLRTALRGAKGPLKSPANAGSGFVPT